MLRALVFLLVLPTMLMPPGMCVCQFMPARPASAAVLDSSARHALASHAATPRSNCNCDSCRTHAASPAAGGTDDRPSDHPNNGPSDPGPDRHWPGCPAAAGAVPLNVVVPTVTVQADLVATLAFFTPVVAVVVSTARPTPLRSPVVSPPLFISHCTLQI